MKDIILVGSGGCMRELAWQMLEQNRERNTWNIQGYVDIKQPENGTGKLVGKQIIPWLGEDGFLLRQTRPVNAVVCVGNPALRKKIVEKLKRNPYIQFPNVILGDTRICEDVKMGMGCIVSMDARISTNVALEDFVFINIGAVVCHDGWLGDFVTLSPHVTLAGNVKVKAGSELGIGTKVIPGVCIGAQVTVGAGSVVIQDIENHCTIAGVPAKSI